MNNISLLQEQMNKYEQSFIIINNEMNILKRKNKYLLDKIKTLESIKHDTVTILSILIHMQRETKDEKNKIVILSYKEIFTQLENEFFKEESNSDKVIETLLNLNLLSQEDIENYPYKDKITQHSYHLTYGLIQSIAIFVLERIPKHLPRRYKLFDISFDNKVREVLESRGQ